MPNYIIHISTDNDAFQQPNLGAELVEVLEQVAPIIDAGYMTYPLRDSNGNTCGKLWEESLFIQRASRMVADLTGSELVDW